MKKHENNYKEIHKEITQNMRLNPFEFTKQPCELSLY